MIFVYVNIYIFKYYQAPIFYIFFRSPFLYFAGENHYIRQNRVTEVVLYYNYIYIFKLFTIRKSLLKIIFE